MGLPYFLIGKLLFEHRKAISDRFTNGIFIACLLIFSISTLVERYILVTNRVNASNDYYISTPFLACTVFLKFTQLRCQKPGAFVGALCGIGKRYCTWIYLLHPLMIGAADLITGEKLNFLRPVVTFVLTLAVCIAATKFSEKSGPLRDRIGLVHENRPPQSVGHWDMPNRQWFHRTGRQSSVQLSICLPRKPATVWASF
jgi:hypothetical protein